MKKLIAITAALLVSAFAFADGFTNRINLGGVYSNTEATLDIDDADTENVTGAGVNISWRGTFSNGLTLLADMDILPSATIDDGKNKSKEWTDASFALGAGYEWSYDKGCYAVAGVLGVEQATKEEAGYDTDVTSSFIGVNLYATYMFNKVVGLYGACTAGVNIGGTVESDVPLSKDLDLKKGDFRIAPKAGLVIKF